MHHHACHIHHHGRYVRALINKARFERYVFAESAVQLAVSNAKIAELVKESKEIDFPVALSAGCAYVSDPKERLEDVLGRADQELYQAKQRLFAKK